MAGRRCDNPFPADAAVRAIGRHVALIGFMGAGKTTIGHEVARLTERPFLDVDVELERRHGATIPELFAERGEAWFRNAEAELTSRLLDGHAPAVLALGGGAVMRAATREALTRRALTLLVDVDVDEAWRRVAISRHRPLAQDEHGFRQLYRERAPVCRETADAVVDDAEGALLACGDVIAEDGALARAGKVLPRDHAVALIGDERVLGLHPPPPDVRIVQTLSVPSGEDAKQLSVCRRLWDELTIDRTGAIVALGGGTTTDVAGFVAATYLRGVPWVPVPTTLVGQVDAAIGGKTGIDLAKGKNLVGAFHLPAAVVADPRLLETLPEAHWREGLAEVVKTGLLSGQELWSLAPTAMVRACAAFKVSVCVADPTEQGRRAILNLGHTFAHGLEAAAGYATVSHGHAVALGLRAALLLSERHLGLDPAVRQEVESVLPVELAAVDGDAAWRAMALDKKARGGALRLVLLQRPGSPVYGVELPADEIRGALATLVAA